MARLPSIVCMTHLGAGPFFPLPLAALFPPLPFAFVAWSSKSAAVASSGWLLLLLFVLVPRRVRLIGCWSAFDAWRLRESAAALVGVLDWVLGGMVGVAV